MMSDWTYSDSGSKAGAGRCLYKVVLLTSKQGCVIKVIWDVRAIECALNTKYVIYEYAA